LVQPAIGSGSVALSLELKSIGVNTRSSNERAWLGRQHLLRRYQGWRKRSRRRGWRLLPFRNRRINLRCLDIERLGDGRGELDRGSRRVSGEGWFRSPRLSGRHAFFRLLREATGTSAAGVGPT
jgi:hypothetical protein